MLLLAACRRRYLYAALSTMRRLLFMAREFPLPIGLVALVGMKLGSSQIRLAAGERRKKKKISPLKPSRSPNSGRRRNPGFASFEGLALNLRAQPDTADQEQLRRRRERYSDQPRARRWRALGAETTGHALLAP